MGRAEAIQCCYMVVVAKALAKEHFSMKIKSQFPALHMAEKKVQLFNFIHSHWYTVVGNIFGRQKIMNLDTTFSSHGMILFVKQMELYTLRMPKSKEPLGLASQSMAYCSTYSAVSRLVPLLADAKGDCKK